MEKPLRLPCLMFDRSVKVIGSGMVEHRRESDCYWEVKEKYQRFYEYIRINSQSLKIAVKLIEYKFKYVCEIDEIKLFKRRKNIR